MRRPWASLGLGAALLAAGPAFGHARLLGTVPAADARLTAPPPSLILRFNENVRLGVLKLTTAGREVPVTIERNAAPAEMVTVPLPRLAAGKYDVQWSALTDSDGHAVKGGYSFVIE
ncbi:MAG: copper resistance CopC family protein [Steroidobacteraceae bacterium]